MLELIVVGALILLNGLFSLSELAVVSARKVRLKVMADAGRRGAKAALALADEPGRFLSTVQIGITLVGILAGAFSGAALGARLSGALEAWGVADAWAEPLGYAVVVGIITYLSVVIGELVPKHLALRNAETIACMVAPSMRVVSIAAGPIVALLDGSTRLIFRLFGGSPGSDSAVTEEEIRTVVAEAETAGVIEDEERAMISAVLRLGDRTVRALMTPRTEVERIDVAAPQEELRAALTKASHSRIPVYEGSDDNMLGVVQARELMSALVRGEPLDLRPHIRQAPIVPDVADAMDVLAVLKRAEVPLALIHDEYGHFEGIVAPADILDALAGAFRSDEEGEEEEAVQRADGSWLLAGWTPVDEVADRLGLALPERRSYETLAGLLISILQHLPTVGETVDALGWHFEIVDLDGKRIDKVIATRL